MLTEDVLGSVSIFAELSSKDLKQLAREAHEMTFPAGTRLTEDDAIGATFFVLAEGTATVSVDDRPVRTLKPGGFFGEMSLIDHQPRSAAVVADSECKCLVFSGWVFRPFALSHPEVAWAMLELMVKRVRDAEGR